MSPLGKYAAPAAAIASLGIIGVYLVSLVFGRSLAISDVAEGNLQAVAFLAAGALFGSAVAVNGYKAPLATQTDQIAQLTSAVTAIASSSVAAHKRLDETGAPPAADGVIPPTLAEPLPPIVPATDPLPAP